MTRTELATASELLNLAADATTDDAAADRLRELAEQVGQRATAEKGPDHGRMARWQTALDEVQSDVSDDVATTIDEALDEIVAYRSTVEGV